MTGEISAIKVVNVSGISCAIVSVKYVNGQGKTVQFKGVNVSGTSSTRSSTHCTRRSRPPPFPTTKAKPMTMKKKNIFCVATILIASI
jgi:hypothetical protein